MPKYTIAKYAKRVNVSRAYIYNLEKEGRIDFIKKDKKTLVDSDQLDPILKYKEAGRATAKTYQKNGAKRKGKKPEGESKNNSNEETEINEGSDRESLDKALVLEKVKKERIANEVKMKTLVDFNKTAETVFNFLRPLRDDLMEIAKRVSPMAYTSSSKGEAEKFINDEIKRIMLSKVGNDYKSDEALKKKIILVLKM